MERKAIEYEHQYESSKAEADCGFQIERKHFDRRITMNMELPRLRLDNPTVKQRVTQYEFDIECAEANLQIARIKPDLSATAYVQEFGGDVKSTKALTWIEAPLIAWSDSSDSGDDDFPRKILDQEEEK